MDLRMLDSMPRSSAAAVPSWPDFRAAASALFCAMALLQLTGCGAGESGTTLPSAASRHSSASAMAPTRAPVTAITTTPVFAPPIKSRLALPPRLSVGVSDEEFIGPFADWVNVKSEYGAVGNGIADDTAAIQNGLNALRKYNGTTGPTVLYFPAGTYRITHTLSMELNMGANLIGADPGTTAIVWGGAVKGTMLITSGSFDTLFTRLTWDGKNTAGIGIAQWWNYVTDRANYQGSIKHTDEVFQNMGIGIFGGRFGADYGQGDSETMILRVKFLNDSTAGINLGSFNAVDWWIWDSQFTNCALGVTDYYSIGDSGPTAGAGQFSINRSVFQGSTVADIAIGNTAPWFGLHNNFSSGSQQFFFAVQNGPNGVPIIMQNNTIINTVNPVAIDVGNEGPLILIDNKIVSAAGATGPAIRMNGTGITAAQDDRDVFSIGNQFTVANAISLAGTSGRILSTDDTTVSPSSIATTAPTLPGLAPNYNRAIFEVPLNATADQVQATINAAVASQSPNAVVHLPAGSYQIDHTLTVPANAQIQIAGDSQATELWWTGTSPTGPVVSLTGPSYATLRDLAIVGGTVTAISLSGADQTGGRVFESASYMSPLSVTGLSHTRVDAQANTGISGLIATSSASVLLVGSGGVPMSLLGNSQVLISDCWFEGTRSNLLTLESGNLTYLGGLLAPYADGYGAGLPRSAPLMTINDYSGQLSVIGVSLNLRSGSNGILVTSASPATQALFLGLSTNATNFFTNDVTADSVGAILSKQSAGAGAYDVADAGDTSSAFVVAGLAQARSVIWETSPMVHTEGTTDVRLFRIATPNTAIGLSVSN